jgi:type II secretory pathway component PulF
MQFVYQAMRPDGQIVMDALDAASQGDAAESLRNKGLMVMKLTAGADDASAGNSGGTISPGFAWLGRPRSSDLVLFTRQMEMLLDAGCGVVPALEAIEQQTTRRSFRGIVHQIREQVEQGGLLSDSFRAHDSLFKSSFCTMVAAGEGTASLAATFTRLSEMAKRQQHVRRTLVSAAIYPSLLMVMCISTCATLIGFVVPRFRMLFDSLRTPIPASTRLMLAISGWATHYWWVILIAAFLPPLAAAIVLRTPAIRDRCDTLFLRLPILGKVGSRLIMARVLGVWAAMLHSHVPLLETIQQSQRAVRNRSVRKLLLQVEDSVAAGGRVGKSLLESTLVEPVIASAVATGEENGRLADSVDFVAQWLDEDNAHLISTLTRIAEPLFLSIMGVVVGAIATSLFVPLFDLATAGG